MVLFLRTLPFKAHPVHQTLHLFVVCLIASVEQFVMHSADAVPALVAFKDLPDNACHRLASLCDRVLFRDFVVVRGSGNIHRSEKVFQLISVLPEFFDDRCFFALSRAASFSSLKAISFFMTSISALMYSFSALSLMSSSYSDSSSFLGLL